MKYYYEMSAADDVILNNNVFSGNRVPQAKKVRTSATLAATTTPTTAAIPINSLRPSLR